jgi:DNA invertase Pin-like site-specific DNA recombinase
MSAEESRKVTTRHLTRNAYLYVRQSTLRQVLENTESTHRQYALQERAVALGWPRDRIVVIDTDLGQSGASAVDREGFQRLVTEVGMGRAGIVLGLEVSRLARNSTDWHRLLEICALADTLILDEDGVYDPGHFNDRLLLGLKGTMSEAELHVLRARLRGGILNKARRGELQCPLPVGFAYDGQGRVVLDPDARVQQSIRLLFDTFGRTGSAWATVKAFREQGIAFPRHMNRGPRDAETVWRQLEHSLVLHVLHNPRYAGAFVFGRHRSRKLPDGRATIETLPRDNWTVCLRDSHAAYITWEQFERNLQRLSELRQCRAEERAKSIPREGCALVQGIVICGRCGQRMSVRYNERGGAMSPTYTCSLETVKQGLPVCQSIPGASIDEAIGTLVLEAITPLTLDAALAVHGEMQTRIEQADRLRRQHVERRRYEAELARRRFLRVDPANRLVAASLEAEWNENLRGLRDAEDEYERHQRLDRAVVSAEQRESILRLASDFSRVWRDPKTPMRERKRLVRLVIEDVTLLKGEEITVHVRFKGGTTKSIVLPRPLAAYEIRKTRPKVITEIDRLLDNHTEGEIAAMLNEQGLRSGERQAFHRLMVQRLREEYGLESRYRRLRRRGLLTLAEVARKLRVKTCTIKEWRRAGLLRAHAYNDKNQYLYEEPGADAPKKYKWKMARRECPGSRSAPGRDG